MESGARSAKSPSSPSCSIHNGSYTNKGCVIMVVCSRSGWCQWNGGTLIHLTESLRVRRWLLLRPLGWKLAMGETTAVLRTSQRKTSVGSSYWFDEKLLPPY